MGPHQSPYRKSRWVLSHKGQEAGSSDRAVLAAAIRAAALEAALYDSGCSHQGLLLPKLGRLHPCCSYDGPSQQPSACLCALLSSKEP